MGNEMNTVLVTGSKGFIGKNLVISLQRMANIYVWGYDIDSPTAVLEEGLAKADTVYHLAGVNRPDHVDEFEKGNTGLTQLVCRLLRSRHKKPILVLSSSNQAAQDNPYGISKRNSEKAVLEFGNETGAAVYVFRLPGVFGKWCRPNYNSVVATFCHNIARDLPISVSDPARGIELVYIDDVVNVFTGILHGHPPVPEGGFSRVAPTYRITLRALAETLQGFRESRNNLLLPDMDDRFIRCLYATYLSYLPTDSFSYTLKQFQDTRGELAELLKSPHSGQFFVSRTRPGIVRGHHYHDTKVEKFIVIEGDAVIRFRSIQGGDIIEYPVSGREFRIVDIPPGYTHSIDNVGTKDLVVLFWANEMFEPTHTDTYAMPVS
jgi:UDP-2-acetamido-2,6-beta-L-arabino-hexul-4-ose reductase